MTFGIIMIILAVCLLLVSVGFLVIWIILTRCPSMTDKARGIKAQTKHKKDVPIWSRGVTHSGPWRIVGRIKDLTKTTYTYSVGEKKYSIRFDFHKRPNLVPMSVVVVHLKKFPRLAYIEDEHSVSNLRYIVCAVACFIFAVTAFFMGLRIMYPWL